MSAFLKTSPGCCQNAAVLRTTENNLELSHFLGRKLLMQDKNFSKKSFPGMTDCLNFGHKKEEHKVSVLG